MLSSSSSACVFTDRNLLFQVCEDTDLGIDTDLGLDTDLGIDCNDAEKLKAPGEKSDEFGFHF